METVVMDASSIIIAIAIAAAIAIAFSTVFPAISQGKSTCKAMEAISRQPEAAGEIRTSLIVSLAFMEALTIYGLLIALLLVTKIPTIAF